MCPTYFDFLTVHYENPLVSRPSMIGMYLPYYDRHDHLKY